MTEPLLVTIDVEGESEPDLYASVDALDRFLDDIAIPVTVFVTPDVISNRIDTIRTWFDSDIFVGLHIHPSRLNGDSDWLASYDQSMIESFLERGSKTFVDAFGTHPTGFRAGRWSFSPKIIHACETTGFEWDASHRPDTYHRPYSRGGLTEYPMSVYGNAFVRRLLRPYGIDGLPLHADSFTRSRPRSLLLYATTARLLVADTDYIMVSLHDYDLLDTQRRERMKRYLERLAKRRLPTTIQEFHQNTYSFGCDS